MPFLLGGGPVRRTLKYLEAGKIIFRETVKIFTVNYTHSAENHRGIRDFVYWHLDQIQYKNPAVQCLTFRNLTPSPFIRIFFENAQDVIINVNCREKNDILDHLINFTAVCKSKDEITAPQKSPKDNPSLFGYGCKKHCMCEPMGQVPCPRVVVLPKSWRRNRKFDKKLFNVPFYYTERGLEEIGED